MEVSSKDPSLIAMDLSKGYAVNSLNCSHAEARDPLGKKPEWYHRPPPGCSTEVGSTYWNRSRPSSSYSTRIMDSSIGDTGVIQLHPDMGGGVRCREMEQGPETIGNYMDTTIAQGLGLYHNGAHGHLWHQRFYECDPAEESPLPESSGGEESDSGSDVIFLVSTTRDALVCSSLSRESVSPVVEPLSPTALSMDEGTGCYLLPQPLSSPSPDSTYSEVSSDSSTDIPVLHARPVVLLPDIREALCMKRNPVDSPVDVSSDDSDVIEVSVTNERKNVIVCPDSAPGQNGVAEETSSRNVREPRSLRRSARIKEVTSTTHHFTHSVSPSPSPPRYHHNLRTKNAKRGFYNECYDSDDVIESLERLSSSEEEPVQSVQSDLKPGAVTKSDDSDGDTQQSCHLPKTKQNKKKSPPIRECKRSRTKPKPRQGTPAKQHIKAPADRKAPVKKTASTRRKRRKKHTETGPSCFFPPRELEIELKYANYKKEKRQNKSDGFHPFVHVEQKVCTVVNYQEQETDMKCNTRQQHTGTGLTGLVPNTSCFQLGRLSTECKCQPTQFCCLCGKSANATGLGDLHGPYYPIGSSRGCPRHQPDCTEPSPGDMSSRQKVDERLHNLANGHGVKMDDKDCDDESTITPSDIKPPVVDGQNVTTAAFHSDECWIHEDCGIWSTGIFLVKGKLYGLYEASGLAQRTVCSLCNKTGAVMGCFQKGCLQSYHYRCAIESGCVLNEENFSMRCPKHKSVPLTLGVTARHRR